MKGTTIEARRVAGLRQRFPDLDFDTLEVGLAVGRASVALDRSLGQQIRPWGLTPVALQTLISVFLSAEGPLSLTDVGEELRVSKANVSRVLAGLERQKLIRRRADPADGRKIRASVTKRGLALMTEVKPKALESVSAGLSALTPEQHEHLKRLAERIS